MKTQELNETSKSRHDHNIRYKCETLQTGDVEKPTKKGKSEGDLLVYYDIEEIYDVIQRAYVATGQDGRDRMTKHLSVKYAKVSREAVECLNHAV